MQCQLIQTKKVNDDNYAEREMLDFLKNLPAEYFVYRELQLTPAYRERVKGLEKKQPDFVVVAPQAGVISIEAKDWNLTLNAYEWRDQYKICRKQLSTGEVTEIDNPSAQADAYLYALMELLSGTTACVASTVAFPRVSRAEFLNKLQNLSVLQNPQSRFYLDLRRVIFKDDLDRNIAHPETLLEELAQKYPSFHASPTSVVEAVNRQLLPSSFRIGDYSKRQENLGRLKTITEQQQRWIFGLDSHKNYLLDVPGSGKTNVLISRAIHLVEQVSEGDDPRILLTTYSRNLETNIKRIFRHKIADNPNRQRLLDAIHIQCLPGLMEQIVVTGLNLDSVAAYRQRDGSETAYEVRLREDVTLVLSDKPDDFRRFDHVFIDEIQDFDNLYLLVVKHLCRQPSYFFVGDIGQKIYDRTYDLSRLGFITEQVELAKSYKMFRTPRFIAELATRFMLGNPQTRQELEEHHYTESFQYPNIRKNHADLLRSTCPEADVATKAKDYLAHTYTEDDLMVVTSPEALGRTKAALEKAGLKVSVGEAREGGAITLVDFMGVKGLEKEVVFVTGMEDLYERSQSRALFDDEDAQIAQELFSRRKIYVSLTRPLEYLMVYYTNPDNRFISELLEIQRQLLAKH